MGWFKKKRDIEEEFLANVYVHAEGLFRYALRLCADEARAADLVQETFTKAFDAYDRLKPNTNHRAWAFTILRNSFISRQRKLKREEELEDPATLVDEKAGDFSLVLVTSEDGYKHAFEDEVLEALESLPETQRTAVVLCDIEGMPYEEIARVMDCPVGTVRSRIHHARKRLRGDLAGFALERGYRSADEAV